MTVALGTVTALGEPRVAPINAIFVGASFYLPTVAEAARAWQGHGVYLRLDAARLYTFARDPERFPVVDA